MTTWQCENCGEEFNIEGAFSAKELAEYTAEMEENSEMIKDMVAMATIDNHPPSPVLSQLAVAIEETLIVCHEPHFIRWACQTLQGIYKPFSPVGHAPSKGANSWAEQAAYYCVRAAEEPILNRLIADTSAAIDCAMRAQWCVTRKSDEVESIDAQTDAQKES